MTGRAVSAPLAQLPNALTIVRFALVPVFVVLMVRADGGHDWAAASIFGAAGITDQIDGWLARRWRVESEFGKYADPLADRVMISAAVILLAEAGRLSWAAVAVIVIRDVALVVGARLVVPRGYEFSVNFAGKLGTWVLYAAVSALLATPGANDWHVGAFWVGAGIALGAAAMYGSVALRVLRGRMA